ncbi:MAG: efflux RND transporter permease subunit [candidate division WOR-3 bacterium]|nr:efflux RND transporter permease subunit [candidate division WOR-3 bacterium]MCX7757079.1 efflux RND transporter permease subunit [candidate division WOR-3 bacterium]
MRISHQAIYHPITTIMVALGLVLFGIISIPRMQVDIFPKVTLPTIAVATLYPGAGPEEVESEVTNPLEKQLGTVNNLKNITSRSSEGISVITLELEWGSNLDAIASDIRDKLNMVETFLPQEVQKPFVLKFSASMIPIVNLVLRGKLAPTELQEIANDITVRLQRLNGVAAVGTAGGLTKQVQINLDLSEIAKRGINLDQIALALKAHNINFPVGTINTQNQKYLIRVIGQFENLDQIKNVIIGKNASSPIFLKDVAEVNWGAEEQKNYVRVNKEDAIFLWVQKRPDANTITVADLVKKEVDNINRTLPPSVNLEIFWDSSESIRRSVRNVITNLILGGLLAIFILFVFLRRFRPTLFVAFAIPTSIFFALFLMYLFGFTINILSMAGLAIAVGMVVDNAIVVFESIYRHRETGAPPFEAAEIGTTEVATAITASTLTTLAVFFPLLLIRGFLKIMFNELSWAVIFSLSASLGIALTLTPMLASRFLKLYPINTQKGFLGISERLYKNLENFYEKGIRWALAHRKTIIWGTLGLFLVSIALVPFLGMEFIPEQQTRFLQVSLEMPKGTNLEKTNEAILQLEEHLFSRWHNEISDYSVEVGEATSIYQQIFGIAGSNFCELNVILKKEARDKLPQIISDISKKTAEIPGLTIRSIGRGGFTRMFAGAPIQVEIIGHDLQIAESLNNQIQELLRSIPEVTALRSSWEKGDPEIQLVIDRVKAGSCGLTPYQIGSVLRTQLAGSTPSYFRIGGKEYDIVLRLKKEQRKEVSQILNTVINSPAGTVLLKDLVKIKTDIAPLYIEHKNNERIITITGEIIGGSAGRVAQKINSLLKTIKTPPGFEIKVSGAYEQMLNAFKDIAFAVLVAIILVYMVMASQFESLRDPFVILFTIPLAIIGVIWILLITNTPLSIISGIGILVLVGIVVNNGIVYIDYSKQLQEKKKLPLEEAVVYAGKVRMRPILMTALTTIFGLLPLALKIGEGSELWSPLGRAVIGGMVIATFLTLIFIPTLYTTFEKMRK